MIRYRLTPEDYSDAMRVAMRRRLWTICMLLGTLVMLLSVIVSPRYQVSVLGGAIIGPLIAAVLIPYLEIPRFARKEHESTPMAQQELGIELLEEGVRFTSPNKDSLIQWAELVKWRQSPKCFLLYISPCQYLVIPKRLKALGLDMQLVSASLERKVGPEAGFWR